MSDRAAHPVHDHSCSRPCMPTMPTDAQSIKQSSVIFRVA